MVKSGKEKEKTGQGWNREAVCKLFWSRFWVHHTIGAS
jgi:hypothetical protein